MEKENPQESKNISIEDYSVFFSKAFTDLLNFAGEDPETFLELYYNRKQEYAEFETIASYLFTSGDNVLVIGDAGIGKSNFIYRLFYESKPLERNKLYPIMIDFRKIATENKLKGIQLTFIDKMLSYYKDMDYTIGASSSNTIAKIDENLHHIQTSFDGLIKRGKKSKHPLVFIDDLDYAENEELFPILNFLMPFARTTHCSILICVRPPLYKVLLNNDSTYSILFAHTAKPIELRSMQIHRS